jgi:hypothetical protein
MDEHWRAAAGVAVHPELDVGLVDLITHIRLGAPFPTWAGSRSSTSLGLTCIPPARLDSLACGVAGLGSLPNHLLALSAVPDLGARLFSTRPPLPAAYATGCGRSSACEG